jgi:hypothetical protein
MILVHGLPLSTFIYVGRHLRNANTYARLLGTDALGRGRLRPPGHELFDVHVERRRYLPEPTQRRRLAAGHHAPEV